MLKWADKTRRRLDSQTDLNIDTCSMIYDGNKSETSSLSSAVSLMDLSSAGRKKLTPVQKKRKAFANSRPKSLIVRPDDIKLDIDNQTSSTLKTEEDQPSKLEATHQTSWHGSTPTSPIDIKNITQNRRYSLNTPPATSRDSLSEPFSGPLKISTKPELLRITTSDGQDRNSHSFWKNLMNKKSWPKRMSDRKFEKSVSLIESYRKIDADDSCHDISPIETDKVGINPGLAEVITCDLPMNNNVSRKESLKSIKRRNGMKRAKKFTKRSTESYSTSDTERCKGDRSPDSGYYDSRFTSLSAAVSSDEDSSAPESPTGSIKNDFQVFLSMRELADSLNHVKSVREARD